MKKWTLFLGAYFCLCLLAACAAAPAAGNAPPEEAMHSAGPSQSGLVTETFRIIGMGEENWLLAKADGTAGDVYAYPTEGGWEADSQRPGALVEITHDGMVLETYPAQFASVTALHTLEEGFDDLATLYLTVLEDLWAADPGLNEGGMAYAGVDLSQTSLSASEQAAVAWAFGQNHGVEPIQGTYEELVEQGYITAETAEGSNAEFWQWGDGCLFTITEKEAGGVSVPKPLTFDAQKWRSGLGAYFFADCISVQSGDGHWDGYVVGSEAIS